MIERLIPLTFPPGLQNSGTTYQSKGRWHAGNCIRFYSGNVEPIGGWVPRTLTGATITGTPNAAVSWQTNDGTSYLVIGTTTKLFVVTGNVVYDITPPIADPGPFAWQLETFGSYLIAVNSVVNGNYGTLWRWTGNVAVPAAAPADPTTGIGKYPGSSFGVVTTPERFLVVLRGWNPPGGLTPSANVVN